MMEALRISSFVSYSPSVSLRSYGKRRYHSSMRCIADVDCGSIREPSDKKGFNKDGFTPAERVILYKCDLIGDEVVKIRKDMEKMEEKIGIDMKKMEERIGKDMEKIGKDMEKMEEKIGKDVERIEAGIRTIQAKFDDMGWGLFKVVADKGSAFLLGLVCASGGYLARSLTEGYDMKKNLMGL